MFIVSQFTCLVEQSDPLLFFFSAAYGTELFAELQLLFFPQIPVLPVQTDCLVKIPLSPLNIF